MMSRKQNDDCLSTPALNLLLRCRYTLCILLLLCCCSSSAWLSTPQRRTVSPMIMYMPSNSPTSQTPNIIAQKMLKNPGVMNKESQAQQRKSGSGIKLSNSVLASCDTLPSFPTAHGLLSPETVMRLDELTRRNGHRSEALMRFLDTYKRHGPMSCLAMLSDPDVLPHLTNAMRDIAA